MLHVLLLILKIIGWILLGIIGMLLLLVMLILFCPIRYQAVISYQGGKTLQAKAKVRYLILSVRVLYDQSREKDKLKQEIRLLWFRLGKKKAEEAEREVEHLADEGFDDAWDDIDDRCYGLYDEQSRWFGSVRTMGKRPYQDADWRTVSVSCARCFDLY